MTIPTSRRRFLAGLFCAPAIIPAAKLMAVRSWIEFPPPKAFDAYGNEFECYTTWFRMMKPFVPKDWLYASKLANMQTLRVSQEVRHGALIAASQVRPLDPEPTPGDYRREA